MFEGEVKAMTFVDYNGSAQRRATAIGSVLVALCALTGCGSPGDVANTTQEDQSISRDLAELNTVEDPLLQGNDIVLHEYGDDRAAPAAAPVQTLAPTKAAPKMLSGAAIRRAVVGHELTDGAHWGWKFKPNGRLIAEENGEQSSQRWRIQGDKLCINAGYGELCYRASRDGRWLQLWRDGVVDIEAELI